MSRVFENQRSFPQVSRGRLEHVLKRIKKKIYALMGVLVQNSVWPVFGQTSSIITAQDGFSDFFHSKVGVIGGFFLYTFVMFSNGVMLV